MSVTLKKRMPRRCVQNFKIYLSEIKKPKVILKLLKSIQWFWLTNKNVLFNIFQ